MKLLISPIAFVIAAYFFWHYLPTKRQKVARKFAITHGMRIAVILVVALALLVAAFFLQSLQLL